MLKLPNKVPKGSIMVEALAAMSILLIVMVASTPPIATAVVTRVQSRRVGQSIQLAQQEIDKIRQIVSTGHSLGTPSIPYGLTDLPPISTGKTRATLTTTAAPTSICVTTTCTATQGRKIRLNSQEFLVQTFITPPILFSTISPGSPNQPVAFKMGVRVYAPGAINNIGSLVNNQTNSSIGLSSNETSQNKAPLVVLYVDFVRGDLSASQQAYQQFLN